MLRGLVYHQGISDSHALNIRGQYFCPPGMDLVCNEQAFSAQAGTEFCTFPSWSRTEVQNPLARLCPAQHGGNHGARLLDIIHPRFVPGMPAGTQFLIIIKAVRLPGNR